MLLYWQSWIDSSLPLQRTVWITGMLSVFCHVFDAAIEPMCIMDGTIILVSRSLLLSLWYK